MVYRPGPSIAFPYYAGGHVVNIKYRTLDKRFSQVKGGSQVFYGVNDLQVGQRWSPLCIALACRISRG
jgi:hypothetical protein